MSIYYADFKKIMTAKILPVQDLHLLPIRLNIHLEESEMTAKQIRNNMCRIWTEHDKIRSAKSKKREIITSKGESTEHYTCSDLSKTWTYAEVSQMIAGDIPKAHYFTDLRLKIMWKNVRKSLISKCMRRAGCQ